MAMDNSSTRKILPEPGKRNILVTSALPYINDVPHLGNIIGCVLSADAFARYCRGRGMNVLYISGTDEYGTTTETRALKDGVTPIEHCNKFHAIHAGIYKWFNIGFDYFGRTTNELQTDIAQDFFLRIKENGYLQERAITEMYCSKHKSFLTDRFVVGGCPICKSPDAQGDQCDHCGQLLNPLEIKNPSCKICGSIPSTKETTRFFLELDKLQPQIEEFFRSSSTSGRWPDNGVAFTADHLKKGLKPLNITRGFKWGTKIPLPGYDDQVFYIWFDACIGYVSITAKYTKDWKEWWQNSKDVQLYQFIGKDNVPFHSVVFPGMLLATKQPWTMLHHLSSTDYLTYEGGKFSKSRGIGVFGDSVRETGVSADVWRFYLLANRPETGNTEFSWESFVSANNDDLVNNLSTFAGRVVESVNSTQFNGVVPACDSQRFETFKAEINRLLKQYNQEMDAVSLRSGVVTALKISQQGNVFLHSQGLDDKLAEDDPAKHGPVIGCAVNLLHLLAAVIAPFMPGTADAIDKQLNAPRLEIPDAWSADSIKPGHKIGKAETLFSHIPKENAQFWHDKFGSEAIQKARKEKAEKKAQQEAVMKSVKDAA